jgi:hypothetical protein
MLTGEDRIKTVQLDKARTMYKPQNKHTRVRPQVFQEKIRPPDRLFPNES